MLLCALTGRVFEPVGLMKRGWNQKTQLGVYLPPGYPDIIPVYFVSTRRRCRVCAFSSGLHFPRTPLANLQPPLHLQPPSPIHSPLLWQTTHHPYQALHSLTPQSRTSTHFTPALSSLSPLPGLVHGELTPALRAPQATTRRDFAAASSLMSQNDRVVALLLPVVISSCSF